MRPCGTARFGPSRHRHRQAETPPALDIDFWHMLLAPAGTPRPIVDRLNSALRAALADPNVGRAFAESGMDIYPPDEETPEAASALLKREIKLWGDVIRANHIATQ
jgi:tripartite-type tricarboxylate transporter receptor subunit TctC